MKEKNDKKYQAAKKTKKHYSIENEVDFLNSDHGIGSDLEFVLFWYPVVILQLW